MGTRRESNGTSLWMARDGLPFALNPTRKTNSTSNCSPTPRPCTSSLQGDRCLMLSPAEPCSSKWKKGGRIFALAASSAMTQPGTVYWPCMTTPFVTWLQRLADDPSNAGVFPGSPEPRVRQTERFPRMYADPQRHKNGIRFKIRIQPQ